MSEFKFVIPSVEEMMRELQELGWTMWRNHRTVWQSPDGRLFRGPALAWKVATGRL